MIKTVQCFPHTLPIISVPKNNCLIANEELMMKLNFQPLSENNLPLLYEWFQKPHIKKWYAREENYTREMIDKKYLPRILQSKSIPNFIICLNEQPIGYIQLYSCAFSLPDGIDYAHPLFTHEKPENVAGIDLFIAEEIYLHQGYATLALQQFINTYARNKFSIVVVDPLKTNVRAIRFFIRNGFKKFAIAQSQSQYELLILSLTRYKAS